MLTLNDPFGNLVSSLINWNVNRRKVILIASCCQPCGSFLGGKEGGGVGSEKGKDFKNRLHQCTMGKDLPFKPRQSNLQLIIKRTETFYRTSLYSISRPVPPQQKLTWRLKMLPNVAKC